MGYALAGFDVVGVDIAPQPNYPFPFHLADALSFPLEGFDAIHASPPCQAFTSMQSVAGNAQAHPDLLAPMRARLDSAGLPYVIENVPGAPLLEPFQLCGSSFALGVPALGRELRRHRLFETNWPMGLLYQCRHRLPACGIYGHHFHLGRRASDGEFSGARALAYGSEAMGIDWMRWPELCEAIPPAYTQMIGEALLQTGLGSWSGIQSSS